MKFWDSSAVVPLIVHQAPSRRADEWFRDDSSIAIWTLTPVEITSALWRLRRDGTLSETTVQGAELRAQELAEASHVVADVDGVQSLARRLLRVHELSAADALQLGAALLWASGQPRAKVLCTLDHRLAVAARREGFSVP